MQLRLSVVLHSTLSTLHTRHFRQSLAMASSAFLTSTFPGQDPATQLQPSVFEILAQQGLVATLGPAADRVAAVAAEMLLSNNFAAAAQMLNRYKVLNSIASLFDLHPALLCQDELLLLANGALQLHHLALHNSSFTEQFYGLERRASSDHSPRIRVAASWLGVVMAPYLRTKLESTFLKCREDIADGIKSPHPKLEKIKQLFVHIFPFVHLLVQTSELCKYKKYFRENICICT